MATPNQNIPPKKTKKVATRQHTISTDEVVPVTSIDTDDISGLENVPYEQTVRKIQFPYKRTLVVGVVIVVAFIAGMFYFHWFGVGLSAKERAQIELKTAVTAVGKLILLRKDDSPVLAKITDAKKLAAQQPFFTNAKDGDELLIFQKSARAIIYSPTRNIIINVGPIRRPNKPNATAPQQTPQVAQTASVEILNGSNTNGLGARMAKIVSSFGDDVIGVTDAKNTNYKKTIVIDMVHTKASAAAADILAKKLQATTTQALPSGEVTSKANIVIILGADASSL